MLSLATKTSWFRCLARATCNIRGNAHLGHDLAFSIATAPSPQPSEIKVRSKDKRLDVSFNDGKTFSFPAELLRVESPSADTKREESSSKFKVVAGRRHVGILNVEAVGHYAIRIHFDDLHSSGIYSWDYLYGLGCSKFSRAKAYIQAVRQHGLSREPRRKSAKSSGSSSPSHGPNDSCRHSH